MDISPTKKHKIVLLEDSHIKGLPTFLNYELNNNYEIINLTKPGANSSILKGSLLESISQLTKNDLLIINFGTNDLEASNYTNTFFNIKDYLMKNVHTNILMLNIPLRYDLHNYSQRNFQITELNSKLNQLCSHLTHTTFYI
jgi:lysophospholipase L1-like esterase